jgi:hypothetical protein
MYGLIVGYENRQEHFTFEPSNPSVNCPFPQMVNSILYRVGHKSIDTSIWDLNAFLTSDLWPTLYIHSTKQFTLSDHKTRASGRWCKVYCIIKR